MQDGCKIRSPMICGICTILKLRTSNFSTPHAPTEETWLKIMSVNMECSAITYLKN